MGPQAPPPPALPLIDISPFLSVSPSPAALQATSGALASACRTHGFFYLANHGIPAELTARILDLARAFFVETPDAEKRRIRRQDAGAGVGDGARGYQVTGENVTLGKRDWHEGIDWYRQVVAGEGVDGDSLRETDEGVLATVVGGGRAPPYALLHGINLWPASPAGFRDVYEGYAERMLRLGTVVVRALGHALRLADPETFVDATRSSFWVMRAIGYPPLDATVAAAGGVSCGEHSDYGCLTLLLTDSTRGALQVRASDGSWIDADPIEGALVVNVGDMVERWTNGEVTSTKHRVVHRGQGYRVSVPFFFEPNWDAMVRPLPECVQRTAGVERWDGIRYGDHLAGKVGGNFHGI